ncbi:MAG: hypothetical protein J7484_06180, partial [Microbacterium sp.]|nr:hypothetical protein [Microbacterium sp.]
MSERFDTSVLREPVDRAVAVAASEERIAREGRGVELRRASVWNWLQTVVLVVLVGVLALLFLNAVYLMAGGRYGITVLIPIAVIMMLPLAIARIRRHLTIREDLELDIHRLERFAAVND